MTDHIGEDQDGGIGGHPAGQGRDGDIAGNPTADQQAFARFFDRYFDRLLRYTRGYMRNDEEAKEIAYTVFSRVWMRKIVFDPGRSPVPLLCTMARTAALDYYRHQKVEDHFATQLLQAAEFDGSRIALDDPERELLAQEFSDRVIQALAKFSPRQREIVLLRWREQLGYEEIAQRLAISKQTVTVHLARARDRLRGVLRDFT